MRERAVRLRFLSCFFLECLFEHDGKRVLSQGRGRLHTVYGARSALSCLRQNNRYGYKEYFTLSQLLRNFAYSMLQDLLCVWRLQCPHSNPHPPEFPRCFGPNPSAKFNGCRSARTHWNLRDAQLRCAHHAEIWNQPVVSTHCITCRTTTKNIELSLKCAPYCALKTRTTFSVSERECHILTVLLLSHLI